MNKVTKKEEQDEIEEEAVEALMAEHMEDMDKEAMEEL